MSRSTSRTTRCLAALVFTFHFSLFTLSANRLSDSQSPYLLQHADNPVDWYPWGPEAFAKAEAENKLVLISIGYSTCHWCHVMNRESFSNEAIAAYLNQHFVCIKIDREERPDIDNVYMTFVQNLTGNAGWPLNVFLTPDKNPFFGGTYFPPQDDPNRGRGFLPLIQEINAFWTQDPASVLARSQTIVDTLNQHSPQANASSTESAVSLNRVSDAISAALFTFDQENKGFGNSQKFPAANTLSLLLRAAATSQVHPDDRNLAQRMALETLDAMLAGGIRDHIGGGFHRYTVDPQWQLPHFEKMLYDQALVTSSLIDAWQLTANPSYRDAATETLDYLLRDLRDERGGFYSAEDAESLDPDNPAQKREGAYYTWTTADFEKLFPDETQRHLLSKYFSLRPDGNAPHGNFPREALAGYNTLRLSAPYSEIAEQSKLPKSITDLIYTGGLNALRQYRETTRARPHLDDKIITSWNGLAISALARAGLVLERPNYTAAAQQAATFLLQNLYDPATQQLSRLYRQDASPVPAFAEDYAYLIAGLLDLYEADANHHWLEKAHQLQLAQNHRFADTANGGYFLFEATPDIIFNRTKQNSDTSLPSANSVSAKNLARLSQLFDDPAFQQQAIANANAFATELDLNGATLPTLREAILTLAQKPLQIVIAGDPASPSVRAMLRELNKRLLPSRTLIYADQTAGQAYLGQHLEFIQTALAYEGQATAFVCENYVCQMPTESPQTLAQQLNAKQ